MGGTWVHRLSEVDQDERRAICAQCGPVPIKVRYLKGGRYRFECRTRVRATNNRNRDDEPWRERRYGLDQESFARLLEQQEGLCAICRSEQADHVDHCHASGAVRGLLCRACNWGLGQFHDSPSNLKAAADYLERAEARQLHR